MGRRVFNTQCRVFAGPGSLTPGVLQGQFPCRLVRQLFIGDPAPGSVPLPQWMTIEGYKPVGAWTTTGFGMDSSLSDQVEVPLGSAFRFWVLYTDTITYGSQPTYFRSYLSPLPIPPPYIPRISEFLRLTSVTGSSAGRILLSSQDRMAERIVLLIPNRSAGRIELAGRSTVPRLIVDAPHLIGNNRILISTNRILSASPRIELSRKQVVQPRLALNVKVGPAANAMTIVQISPVSHSAATSGGTVTFSAPTTAGNLVVALIATVQTGAYASAPGMTTLSGFTEQSHQGNSSGPVGGASTTMLYYTNCPSISSATFGWTSPAMGWAMWLIEISAAATGGTKDQDSETAGTGTAQGGNTVGTAHTGPEIIIQLGSSWCYVASQTMGSISAGWTLGGSYAIGNGLGYWGYKNVTGPFSAQGFSVTTSNSACWWAESIMSFY